MSLSPGLSSPVDVRLGRGCLSDLAGVLGSRTFGIVTTPGMPHRAWWREFYERLPGASLGIVTVTPNPTFEDIERCHAGIQPDADAIVAVGGGSAIDTAKAIAYLPRTARAGALREMAKSPGAPPLGGRRVIAVPTTAGTGSEVTCWATVWEQGTGRKWSVDHEGLYPEAAFLDATVLDSLPFEHSLVPALDALSHACESVWNRRANQTADGLAELAIRDLAGQLVASFASSYKTPRVRDTLQVASLRAGLAFSTTRTAVAHSISYPLTGVWGVPHGLACSITLPEVLETAGTADPDRVKPVLRGLGVDDLGDGVRRLAHVLRASGGDRMMCLRRPTNGRSTDLEALLITPGRADNFLIPVSAADARGILDQALARASGSARDSS